MRILIKNQQKMPVNLPKLRKLAKYCLQAENAPESAELSILLTDDASIAELNKHYRGIDEPTDVLSFALNEGDSSFPEVEECEAPLGDIVISVETCYRQAEESGRTPEDEISFILTHGILHILGYDHSTDSEADIMFARQRELSGVE